MAKHVLRQIDLLKERIRSVGGLVEAAISDAIKAFSDRDAAAARTVLRRDAEIDRLEVEVEEECLKILTLYQPAAGDLRFVIAVLKINNDLERTGDLAANIAKRVLFLVERPAPDVDVDFRLMAVRAQGMLQNSLEALVKADVNQAYEVRRSDDILDAMRREFHQQIRAVIRQMPDQTEPLLKLYAIAKHLERIGDMAASIAADVIYMVNGDIVRHLEED
ncbi:MAG TPA: phosphate signaling complex protein PhoU [Pirellulales bacterium]|jgi:phosphate transport system protein|nr:phosphate signaling complex protein PhoU [Pirellulales bacterium]